MHNKQLKSYTNLLYKQNLFYFFLRSFPIVNQDCFCQKNWHIYAISSALEEVINGNIKRLIINIPPRYLKSFCVSVSFPTWILGKWPNKRIVIASYSEKLAIKHSLDSRLIMRSNWFKNLFPNCILSRNQNEKYKFSTTMNGYRFATSVGGTLTGEGGDILIIDDPHNPQQVLSNKYREKTLNWYSNTFSSRLDDKKNGVIIIVMQRLHPNDLTGYLLEKDKNGWFHLNLPVYFENYTEIKVGKFEKIILPGEYLFPERENKDEIEKIKKDMGSYFFNAQYLQKPMLNTNSIFKKEWLYKYQNDYNYNNIYLSFDTAIKTGIKNDPTVCTIWGEYENKYYLIDTFRKWLEYPELKNETIKLINKWQPNAVLIEDKASGQSLIQDLRKELKINIIAIKAIKDKITRFASVTPMFESRRVFIKQNDIWLFDYEYELLAFPNGQYDDQVDSTSQFLNWVNNKKNNINNSFRIVRL